MSAATAADGGFWSGLDAEGWIALSALAVALVAVPITVLATRNWGTRRAKVSILIASVPVLPEQAGKGRLEVSYRDIPVKEPHLVTVALRNDGPRDLASGMFDGGKPISVTFDQTFYGLTEVHGGVRTISPAIGASGKDARVEIQPALLKRGGVWGFTAVTSGPVEATVNAPLVDTDIDEVRPQALEDDRPEVAIKLGFLGVTMEVPLSAFRSRRRF